MGDDMISVVLVMAGNSSRMRMNTKKAFLPLGNKMVYEYSVDLFLSYGFEIVCVIKEEDCSFLDKYAGRVKLVYGGNSRQESVYRGLLEATGEYVLIHDVARPFVDKRIIEDCLNAIKERSSFLVTIPCKDTPYQAVPFSPLERSNLTLAQTPQGGKLEELLFAHQQAIKDNFNATDDISLLLRYGKSPIKLIEGNERNFKITTQLDYIMAKELVKNG